MAYDNPYTYSSQENTWVCPKCRTMNSGNFCFLCGSAKPKTSAGKSCKCGYVNQIDAKFCTNCGSNLSAPQAAAVKKQPAPQTGKKTGKNKILALVLVAVLALGLYLVLTHEHTWEPATCKSPRKCEICGKTEGEKAEHNWLPGTCYEKPTCSVCGETKGFVPGHSWQVATYTAPKTCTRCGMTVGEKLSIPGFEIPDGETNYIASLTGRSEQVRLESGSSILNVHATIYAAKVHKCEELTVNLSVEMMYGTKCTDWQLWGRVNGSFQEIGQFQLPGGNGDTTQVIRFDQPITFDALAVTPTIPGGYSWKSSFYVTDLYLAQ